MHCFEQCQSAERCSRGLWEEPPEAWNSLGTRMRSMQQQMRRISWAASLLPADNYVAPISGGSWGMAWKFCMSKRKNLDLKGGRGLGMPLDPSMPPSPCQVQGFSLLLSARSAMWSMPVVLTETESENDSVNQNYVAKMTLQK